MLFHNSFREVIFSTMIIAAASIYYITLNSKTKKDYLKITGSIEYLNDNYKKLPNRNKGKYRYLKVESYPYIFEIYKPNSKVTKNTIDNLNVCDTIDVYFFETLLDEDLDKINRHVQYVDYKNKSYFIRNEFQSQVGYVVLILSAMINILSYIFWKKGKLPW